MSKDMGAYEAQIYVFNVSVGENRRKQVGNVLEFNSDSPYLIQGIRTCTDWVNRCYSDPTTSYT